MKRIQHPYFAKEFQKVDQHLQPMCVICEEKLRGQQRRFCSPKCQNKHRNLEVKNEHSTYGTGILSLDYDPNGIFSGSFDEYPIDPEIMARAEAQEEKYIYDHGVKSLISKMNKRRKGAFKNPRKNTLNNFN